MSPDSLGGFCILERQPGLMIMLKSCFWILRVVKRRRKILNCAILILLFITLMDLLGVNITNNDATDVDDDDDRDVANNWITAKITHRHSYIFIIRLYSTDGLLRDVITETWKKFSDQYSHIYNHTVDAKLIFLTEYINLKRADVLYSIETSENDGSFVSSGMTFKELLHKNRDRKYFIFSKDSAFVNFLNIVVLLETQGW